MTSEAPESASVLAALQLRAETVRILRETASGGSDFSAVERAAEGHERLPRGDTTGDVVWAFAQLLRSLTLALEWGRAVLVAEPDADRFGRAARLTAQGVLDVDGHRPWPPSLVEGAQILAAIEDPRQAEQVAGLLAEVVLPARNTSLFLSPQRTVPPIHDDGTAVQRLPSAALLIQHNGEPIMRPTPLQPGALHQFEIEVRLFDWPDDAYALDVDFLHVYPEDYLHVGTVTFNPEGLTQPLEIRIAGDRPATDPPLQITARASLRIDGESNPVPVIGNTTIELTTFDAETAYPLNQPTAARRLQAMMEELRVAIPALSNADRDDVRLLLHGIARFAHTVLDDRLIRHGDAVGERWFQSELKSFLQADSSIGARLEEGTHRAGGETDLVLGETILELKVEKARPITIQDAERYMSQVVQYASANDRQVSLLAILDVSKKPAPAGVMGNAMGWIYPATTAGTNPDFPSVVGVVVIYAGFPFPSSYSR